MSTIGDLSLRTVLSKKKQPPISVLPCKLRFLKYPQPPRNTTESILSVFSGRQAWNSEAQQALDALKIKLGYRAVREVIKALSNVDVAVGFFHWAAQQQDFKHNTKTYSAIVRLVGESGNLKLMNSFVLQMHQEGCPVTPYFLADIMMVYGHHKMAKQAFQVFKEMSNAGLQPNQFVHNCLISILLRCGHFEGAQKVFDMMRTGNKCLPDAITYNMLIDKCGKSGDVLRAQQYCMEMRHKGVCPNEKSYASLLGSLGKSGKIEKACDVFNVIKSKGRLVNRVTYTELIKGLGRAGESMKALELFREMEESGCEMDVVVYNVVLDILVKQKMIGQAWKLFVNMQARQCAPNVVTYNTLIGGFCKEKRVDEAFRWYDKMKGDGITPDAHTYSILVGGLCKLGQIDAAYIFLTKRQSSSVLQENKLGTNDRIDKDADGRMIESIPVHNTMLNGLVKSERLEMACAHLQLMEKSGYVPDVFSFSVVIHGLGKAGKPNDALAMYQKMKKLGIKPNLVTFNTLIDLLGKAGMVFEVHELLQEMRSLGLKPDNITYTSLLPVADKDSHKPQKLNPSAIKLRFDHVLGMPNVNDI
ncbi:hypothetical protein KP509_25G036800 [Ceratopteris richardii]|uniref:Pentatricopeptide repeat-containing protein n=2 Tax=Ceratopteris richardii TaxID=49495 RepID=A0A8T2RPG7_CERRI|nr:hypothetical protein KP509_25G036800 [Ceratopteris richardii]